MSRSYFFRVVVVLLLAACSEDSEIGSPAFDVTETGYDAAALDSDAGFDVSISCQPPSIPGGDGLQTYQREIVERLTGTLEITDGVTLSDRASEEARDAVRTFLIQELELLGLVPQEHVYFGGANVYAEIGATEDELSTIVVGAHFDSVPECPGADDNATGVAVVLGVARYLTQLDCRTENVIFVFFDQEEVGLFGSFLFANWLDAHLIDVSSVHTIDMVGWDSDGDRAVEIEQAAPGLYDLYVAAESAGDFGIPLLETDGGNTDHVSFRALGFNAVGLVEEFVGEDTTPYLHSPQDTSATIDFGYLESTTILVAYTLGRALHPEVSTD